MTGSCVRNRERCPILLLHILVRIYFFPTTYFPTYNSIHIRRIPQYLTSKLRIIRIFSLSQYDLHRKHDRIIRTRCLWSPMQCGTPRSNPASKRKAQHQRKAPHQGHARRRPQSGQRYYYILLPGVSPLHDYLYWGTFPPRRILERQYTGALSPPIEYWGTFPPVEYRNNRLSGHFPPRNYYYNGALLPMLLVPIHTNRISLALLVLFVLFVILVLLIYLYCSAAVADSYVVYRENAHRHRSTFPQERKSSSPTE